MSDIKTTNKAIWSKLVQAQAELRVPKSRTNNFGGYQYRSAEDILNALKPILAHLGLFLSVTDEIRELAGRHYLVATVRVVDVDTGDVVETQGWARETENKKGMDEAQVTGSASSYARKYALGGMFAIDDTAADPDAQERVEISPTTKQALFAKAKELGAVDKMGDILHRVYGVQNSSDLTEKQGLDLLENLTKYLGV